MYSQTVYFYLIWCIFHSDNPNEREYIEVAVMSFKDYQHSQKSIKSNNQKPMHMPIFLPGTRTEKPSRRSSKKSRTDGPESRIGTLYELLSDGSRRTDPK